MIHYGTHGAGVNPIIRLRDQVRNPRGGELKFVITRCRGVKGAIFGITVYVSKAHRRYKHRVDDWGLMACRLDGDDLMVVLNAVGAFGMGRASYWWSRSFSILARCGISITGRSY